MVKHTQTIRRQFADELFECAWSFCGVGAYRVKETGNLFMIWFEASGLRLHDFATQLLRL